FALGFLCAYYTGIGSELPVAERESRKRARENRPRRGTFLLGVGNLPVVPVLCLALGELFIAVRPVVLERARVLARMADGLPQAELLLGEPLSAALALALVGVRVPCIVEEVVAGPYLHEIAMRDLAGVQPVVDGRLGPLEHARKVGLGHAPGRHHPIEHLSNGRIF